MNLICPRGSLLGLWFAFLFIPNLFATTHAAGVQHFPIRENGTLPVWLVAGPFPNGMPLTHGPGCFGYYKDYLESIGGESNCMPSEGDRVVFGKDLEVVWSSVFSEPDGLLNFLEVFGSDGKTPGVAYAYCRIDCAIPQNAILKVRSNDGVRIWVNGERVHDHHVGRTIDEGGEDRIEVDLQQGENRLLVKVDQSQGGWGQKVTIVGLDGRPIPNLTEAIQTDAVVAGQIRSATFSSSPLVLETEEGERQMLLGGVSSGGVENVSCRMILEGEAEPQILPIGDLPLGEHRIELLIPPLSEDRTARMVLECPSDRFEIPDILLNKPREWTVYLVQHTHTDIGYTRPQDEILPDFLRQIDYALDYCDLTDSYPDDSKFRWTCETTWAVREYLKRRPVEQIERLKRRVQEGRIEIAGMFLNFDEITDENTLAASLQPIREFHERGFPVVTAMQNDVPGVAWALIDYFSDMGIKYLSMGINNDRTPRPFDRPTAFWWESPSGRRVLAWRPDHYHTGNHLRLHQDRIEPVQEKVVEYLESMEKAGYPFDRIAIQYSGTQIDNSPPAMTECDLIRSWNETHVWPKLRSATAHEFFEYVESQHGEGLPVYRGAWPNWWTDGYAFAHVETAEARKAHAELKVAEGLLSIAALLGEKTPPSSFAEIRDIEEDLLFYDEHTFGAQEEFSHPTAENSIVQYQMKVSHVWEAAKNVQLLKETAWGSLLPHIPRDSQPTIAVFNTLSWPRSGRVDVYIGHEILPLDREFRIVDLANGQSVPAQVDRSRFEGTYWNLWVEEVPAMGFKTLQIEVDDKPVASPANATSDSQVLENAFYRLVVEATSGTIVSLYDKELDRELVETESPYGFGQFIYDRLFDSHFFDRESFLARSTRSTLREVNVVNQGGCPLWQSLRISGEAEGCLNTENQSGLECEIRLYHAEKRIEFQYFIRKKFIPQPESVYVAFPFAFPDGKILYEAQGGLVQPGVDQLPGSSADWHTIQNFISVRDDNAQAVLISDEIPLVQFGDINMGKWQSIAQVENPFVFSWVMNNYWTSNFPGVKESEFTWSYHLTSSPDLSNEFATRFGWGARTPLAAVVLPAGKRIDGEVMRSSLILENPNVLLVQATPAEDGSGIVCHLREVGGKKTEVDFDFQGSLPPRIDRVTVLGDPLEEDVDPLVLDPFGIQFVNLVFRDATP